MQNNKKLNNSDIMPTNNDSGKKYLFQKNCQACNTHLSKIPKGRVYRVQKENVIRILNQFGTKSNNIIKPNDYVCDSCISSCKSKSKKLKEVNDSLNLDQEVIF